MRTAILGLVLVISATGVQAQSWCAPGAEWVFRPSMPPQWTNEYAHLKYVGDTLFDGRQAQRISLDYAAVDWYTTPPWVHSFSVSLKYLTHTDNDIVSLWDWEAERWDTLYWFGQIGDRWHGALGEAGVSWYEITDTASIVIDGVSLRTVWVDYFCEGQTWYGQLLTERMGGSLEMTMFEPCIFTYDGFPELMCYRDDEIGMNDLNSCLFEIPLGVPSDRIADHLPLYPNPGTTHFTIDLPSGIHTIELFDATGRRVHHLRTTGQRTEVPTADLPAGIYHVRVDGHGQAWVKE